MRRSRSARDEALGRPAGREPGERAALDAAPVERVEAALWQSVRAPEENAEFARKLAGRARVQNVERAAGRFDRRATSADEHASVIRWLVLGVVADEEGDVSWRAGSRIS